MGTNRLVFALTYLVAAISQASAQELIERATFKSDTFQVTKSALSSDGNILAAGGGDTRGGILKLWDTKTGKEIASLPGYTDYLFALVFSRDGKTLASAGASVQVWDVGTHTQIHKFGNRNSWPGTLAFSQDGKRLASASSSQTHVWDVKTGKEITSWKRKDYSRGAMALSPDLATLANGDYQEIDLCDSASGKISGTLSEHRGEVNFLSYSEDGKTLVAASSWYSDHTSNHKGDLKLWDVASRSERVSFKGPFGRILQARLSPDGKILALLDSPELRVIPDIKLIEIATGRQTIIRKRPDYSFMSLAFTRDGRLLVVGTSDESTLKLWQVNMLRK
jgi:WD40 repeat protein